jgi:uncharacterized protein
MRRWICAVVVIVSLGGGQSSAQPLPARDQLPPLSTLLPDCEARKGQSCLFAGVRYLNGFDVPKDLARALSFYLKACRLKVARGCGFAGSILVIGGVGVAVDVKKGHALREQACTLGDAPSCNDLGSDWADGKRGATSRDYGKAKRYYGKACHLKDGLGCFNLGNVYRLGEGVKVDLKLAIQHFARSCELDAAKGCTELAIIYFEGKAAPRNVERAMSLLEKACKLGSEVGCKNLKILRSRQRR